jgi:hypothetical protein
MAMAAEAEAAREARAKVKKTHIQRKIGGGASVYFSFLTHIKCILSRLYVHNCIARTSLKTYTLAGFEPGSSVPEADAMSTAPRHQGK